MESPPEREPFAPAEAANTLLHKKGDFSNIHGFSPNRELATTVFTLNKVTLRANGNFHDIYDFYEIYGFRVSRDAATVYR